MVIQCYLHDPPLYSRPPQSRNSEFAASVVCGFFFQSLTKNCLWKPPDQHSCIITVYHVWLVFPNCRKNIPLDGNISDERAQKLYQQFAIGDNAESTEEPQPGPSTAPKPEDFQANKGWSIFRGIFRAQTIQISIYTHLLTTLKMFSFSQFCGCLRHVTPPRVVDCSYIYS